MFNWQRRKNLDFFKSEDWNQFKNNVWKHKKKLGVITAILFWPLYRNTIFGYFYQYQQSSGDKLSENFKKGMQDSYKFPFIKNFVVNAVSKDPRLIDGGQKYVVDDLSREERILKNFQIMMVHSIKDPVFLEAADKLVKILGSDQLLDPTVCKDVTNLLVDQMRDPEIQAEARNVLENCVRDPEVKEAMTNLFIRSFKDDKLAKNFHLMLTDCLYDFYTSQKSVDSMRTFLYNFTNTHEKDAFADKTLQEQILIKLMANQNVDQKSEIQDLVEKYNKDTP